MKGKGLLQDNPIYVCIQLPLELFCWCFLYPLDNIINYVLLISIPGLMGASSSDDTKELQQFAEDNDLPLVSYAASAPELSDVNEYKNFMRTIPPDGQLTKVHLIYFDIVTLSQLSYILLV